MEVGDAHICAYIQVICSGFYGFFVKAKSGIFSQALIHIFWLLFLLYHLLRGTAHVLLQHVGQLLDSSGKLINRSCVPGSSGR